MQAESAGPYFSMIAAAHLVGGRLFAVIAKAHSHTSAQGFDRKGNGLIIAQIVGVTDHIRASFIDAEHHQGPLLFRKWVPGEKSSHETAHQREIRGMAGELELSFLHSPNNTRALPQRSIKSSMRIL